MRWRLPLYLLALVVVVAATRLVPRDSVAERFDDGSEVIHFASVRVGDDPSWRSSIVDERAWRTALLYNLPNVRTVWIRSSIDLTPGQVAQPLALYVSMSASHQVFWNGALVGSSGGIAADGGAAFPGPIDNYYPLDRHLTRPGRHLLAIRAAPGPPLRPGFFHGVAVGHAESMIRARYIAQLLPIAGLGVFAIVGVHFLFLWVAARRERNLVFSLLCFAAGLLVMAEAWRWVLGIRYDWQVVRLWTLAALTFTVCWLLAFFFFTEFRLPGRRWWALGTTAVLLICLGVGDNIDGRCLLMFASSIVISAAATIEAAIARRSEVVASAVGLAALGVALATGGYGFSDRTFFVAFVFLIGALLLSMAAQMRREKREHESALLRAARLEIELLRKSIQPHFLMNTLTAVMEWLEQDPPAGLRFLQALADELRIFAEVSNEPLISLRQELELCHSHLAVMSCRKGTTFALDAEGVDPRSMIPPATLHTLLENAITHNRFDTDHVIFRVRQEEGQGMRRFTIETPFRPAGDAHGEGMGHRYIRTRLEESYPGAWTFQAAAENDVWRTIIEVPAA